MNVNVVDPLRIAAALEELWSPRVIGELDDCYVKVAKVHGTLGWHAHDHEDELFHVLQGTLRIELRDRSVDIGAGQLFVVPKGVEHNPSAASPCLIMLIERKSTRHTGDSVTAYTRAIDEQLRPVEPSAP